MRSEGMIWNGLIVAVLLTVLAFVSGACAADTYTVCLGGGCNYTSIQDAIDAANPFDTIIVRDGTYNENIDVTVDNVTIRSENGSSNCIVQALSASDHVFEVIADYVNISGFTIQNATGIEKAGIYLYNVDHCAISENNASNNKYGIYLQFSSNNNLTNNTASNNDYGISLYWYSNHNDLTGNTANSNNDNGISLTVLNNNNNLTGNTASDNNNGIYLYASDNNNLTGNTANSNNDYGICLFSSNTNTLTGNTASNNHHSGIYLDSLSNTLTGNIANSNGYYGFYLELGSNYNDLTGNTASNNSRGIYLESSSNYNNLTSNTASNNDYGICLESSSNYNNLTSNTASNNSYGIYLQASSNNDLTANKVSNNRGQMLSSGIYLFYSSNNNNLTGNTASNNDYGICLESSTNNDLSGNTAHSNNFNGIVLYNSNNNHIYNNHFNNTNNAWDNGNNIWNITQTSGTNIIGGPNLGGNYWSDYTGNDTDGDGLGDTPYDIPGGTNKDYLPLVAIFDTGQGTYPSIMGTHNGTITLNQTITVSKLYTYPCIGTGGHTEYVKIWQGTETIIEESWNGYTGDWHNITFNQPFILRENETYNYTIRTGSYPQIIHEQEFNATGGVITCSEFVDVNGKRHEGWIPAIRLE